MVRMKICILILQNYHMFLIFSKSNAKQEGIEEKKAHYIKV